MLSHLRHLICQLNYFLFTPYCILCECVLHQETVLCTPCQKDLPILVHFCLCCAQMLTGNAKICGTCLTERAFFDQIHSIYHYAAPLDYLILQLKFHHRLGLAQFFGKQLIHAYSQMYTGLDSYPHLIMPVPLHTKRLQERGFNQALEIAKPLSKATRIPLDITGVIRSKITVPQHRLSAKARKKNLESAFQTQRSYADKKILIIDDVVTTTHTVNALAKLLKYNGASEVRILSVARCSLT